MNDPTLTFFDFQKKLIQMEEGFLNKIEHRVGKRGRGGEVEDLLKIPLKF